MKKPPVTDSAEAGRAYGGRSLDERRRHRRAQFVAAGIEVFGREGYRGATVKALCRQAGLTERYFYESFGNSESLFAEVYKTLVARLQHDVVAAIDRAPQDAESTARAGLRVFFETMYEQPGTARILLIEIFGISGEIDKLYRSTTQNFTRMLAELVSAIFPLEAAGPTDPAIVSTGLVGSTIHIAMYWTLSRYRDPLNVVVESSLALYVAVARQMAAPEKGATADDADDAAS
ncbi:TetR/AcrR family transcriptional regulator [Salinisphaera sp. T31B1]|uniref:TetR/AcrR family transcriptional regulator n=1 Tax=Salinisphaera sp. T31B1 TaxID=727963 RepID=UPI00333F08B6